MTATVTGQQPQSPPWQYAGGGVHLVGVAAMSVIYAPQPLLGVIADQFEQTAAAANLVVSATTLGIALGVFPTAWLAGRIGRGRTIAGALAAGVLTTVLTATAQEWVWLVAARLLSGFAIAAVLVSALTWATEIVPRITARRVAAYYVAGTTAGGMVGRIVAGLLTDEFGWRVALGAVDALVLVCSIAGLLLVALFRRHHEVTDEDGSWAGSVPASRGRGIRIRLYVLGFLGTAIFVGIYNAIAFRMLEPPFSLGVGVTSLLFLTYLSGTFSSVQAGRALDRFGVRTVAGAGFGIVAVGSMLTLVGSLPVIIVALLVLAAGFFIAHTALSTTVPLLAPRPTTGSALYTLFYYSGSSLGAVLFGYAWDVGRWPTVIMVASALALIALAVTFSIPRIADDQPSNKREHNP